VLDYRERVVEPYLARLWLERTEKRIDINSNLFFVTFSCFDRAENVTVPS
jgi:hypothetical protein